jgi:hypothetical protein
VRRKWERTQWTNLEPWSKGGFFAACLFLNVVGWGNKSTFRPN